MNLVADLLTFWLRCISLITPFDNYEVSNDDSLALILLIFSSALTHPRLTGSGLSCLAFRWIHYLLPAQAESMTPLRGDRER